MHCILLVNLCVYIHVVCKVFATNSHVKKSLCNNCEDLFIYSVVCAMQCGVGAGRVGVVTPYRYQQRKIREALADLVTLNISKGETVMYCMLYIKCRFGPSSDGLAQILDYSSVQRLAK